VTVPTIPGISDDMPATKNPVRVIDGQDMKSVESVSRKKDPLLEPFRLKKLVIRNRILSTSHANGLEVNGLPKERYQLYHAEKAYGGIGLTMFGGSSNVAPDSPNVFRQLNVGNDSIIPYFRQFAERIHALGAKLMCQITHLGRRGEPYVDNWLPTVGPSPLRESLHRSFPKEMDRADIDRIVKAFGEAARRCKEGGLDGIEIVGGAHLIGQFFSPRTNHRSDSFGGSLANRCRFGLMVFDEIRSQVGSDFVVGLRQTVEEGLGDSELRFDDCVEIARAFEAAGTVDFFNALYGKHDTERSLAVDWIPGMDSPIAPWLSRVAAFKKEIKLPVFHAAKIADIATARFAIAEDMLDMVGMTRPHIADPHIVRKLEAGLENTIRPCVGATHCQSNFRPHCLHNAATGRELELPHTIARSTRAGRRVVIIGGGPAGLEAARLSAERGHNVLLLEAADDVGGQLRLGGRSGWRRDIRGIVDWRKGELARLGVEIRTNFYAEPENVRAETPDVVIVATGGIPDLDWLPGNELACTVWDLLAGNAPVGHDLLIYDGTGRHPALMAAEYASSHQGTISLVTADGTFGQELTYADRVAWKKKFYSLNIPVTYDHRLERIERRGNGLIAVLRNVVTETVIERPAAQIVVEHGTVPTNDLFDGLRAHSKNGGVTDLDAFIKGHPQPASNEAANSGFELYRIGDAIASRNVHAAILDALRLCASI
jgi:2,4-dienoyl-CoA reductase-like NADH-dependent reductase (Old Yellow Enzyme family)/thioredoxin reductase